MFGKLLKNDLKAQWHSISVVLFAVAIIMVAGEGVALFAETPLGRVLGGLAVIAALLFACVFILVAVAMLYSKTMFGRAGYLTLTLPVKTSKLIWAKTVSGLVWTYLVYFLFIGACVLWFYQVKEIMGEESLETAETLLTFFGMPSFRSIAILCIFLAVSLGITLLLIIQCIQLGITLSNVKPFSKFGIIGAIAVFFISFWCIQTLSEACAKLLPMGMVVTSQVVSFTSNVTETASQFKEQTINISFMGPLFRLVMGILFNIPIAYLTKENVNVK